MSVHLRGGSAERQAQRAALNHYEEWATVFRVHISGVNGGCGMCEELLKRVADRDPSATAEALRLHVGTVLSSGLLRSC